MYILTSPDRPTINCHISNTLEVAEKVKQYIENKYQCTIKIEETPGRVYFDCPGPKCLKPGLYKVLAGDIEVTIDDIDVLACYFYKVPSFELGFMRITSFHRIISLSEEEFNNTRKWFQDNKELVEGYIEEATEIICGKKSDEEKINKQV